MEYYVSAKAFRSGDGTKDHPFKSIGEAARLAKPGDEVIAAPGIYREYVDPANAGFSDARITYRSEEPLAAVITGAEIVKNWKKHEGDTWVSRIGNGIFGDYNPYTVTVAGDWYYATVPVHTGEVYLTMGKAGQTKGGHYHPQAVEWFTLIEGSAILKLEDVATHERKDIEMSLEKSITVFIPNNVAHVVENNGSSDFILLAYTDKLYDPKDTIAYTIK